MKRILDVSTVVKDFTGQPIKEDGRDMSLKNVLLVYIRNGNSMKLSPTEESILYAVGTRIGISDKEVSFSPEQYDVLKKIVDMNRVTLQGQEIPVMGLETAGFIKEIVAAMPVVKEE